MSSDSDDDTLLAQICQMVTNSDSVLLQYPKLFELDEMPERHVEDYETLAETDSLPEDSRSPKKHVENHETLAILNSSPDDFRSQFQMSRDCFADFKSKLGSHVRIFSIEKKLLFSILMLTSQESFESLGKCFNYSKSSAHLAFGEILEGILGLFPTYVKWPSVNEYQEISQVFKEKNGGYIPGIVGAIGACHFEIRTPIVHPDDYKNHKNTHSIILQAVCDHRKIFTDIYVGSPGGRNEGMVFLESDLCEQMEILMPGEYHIVGESMYPLMRNLVVPFRETPNLRQNKIRFNQILRSAIVVIDQALVALREKFKKLKLIETANPEMANRIICGCLTLYNHIRMFEDFEEEDKYATEGNSFISHDVVFDEEISDSNQDRRKVGSIKRNFLMSLCD